MFIVLPLNFILITTSMVQSKCRWCCVWKCRWCSVWKLRGKFGVIIQVHHGQVVAAMSKKIKPLLGPLEVERKAMEEGIGFAWDMGILDAIFEGDSQVVIYPLMGSPTSPIHISNNISNSLLQLQQFCHFCLSHIPRNGNKASYALAQHARGISNLSLG